MKQRIGVLALIFLCWSVISRAQAPTAIVNGQVRDTSGAAIPNASVEVINDATNVRYTTETNDEGIYSAPNLPPGTYHIRVSKQGFKTIVHPDITLNVQDAKAIGFTLPVGPISDTVTVEGGAPLIDTESATVSTVVDRQFADNLPLNGRSFQTLIQLTPGVVLTISNANDAGQFSINGQRANANYWTVDGVGANIGVGVFGTPANGLGGALPSFSVQGGTNSLVSVDSLQEFRVQTSTYAPEFGRTPGGQISIVTRSGTNQFHGTLFDYFRNDVLDAKDWFANTEGLPKPQERQNDFGGTFSGPVLKDKTFFFFSYEGLRLRLPQTSLTIVPDASFTPGGTRNSRQNAVPALQPYLNAFPLPNPTSPEIFVACDPATDPSCPSSGQKATGTAALNASFSNSSTLDAYSLRVDHRLNSKLNLFGRYNYSPSDLVQRGFSSNVALSAVSLARITTQTATVGATWTMAPRIVNDLRFNYSRTNSSGRFVLDDFGGAVPLASPPFPSPLTSRDAIFVFTIFGSNIIGINQGKGQRNVQRQINIVDNLSVQRGSHSLKFGIDFRRLSPLFDPNAYNQNVSFSDVPSAAAGNLSFALLISNRGGTLLFRNLGAFAQDTWQVFPRLTLSYGLRWDVDVAPSTSDGPGLLAVTGFDLNDPSKLALAPAGTPVFKTTYGNLAPRVGLAYQLSHKQGWGTVLRGGFGVFYDLATQETGNLIGSGIFPFGALKFAFGGNFPLDPATAAPPAIDPSALKPPFGVLSAFDPHLELPYTLEWNVALEQAMGRQQTISASYLGAVGRRLIQSSFIISPNTSFGNAQLVGNTATSDYHGLQLQFQRRLSRGLQALASYTWSHSLDTASAGSVFGNQANALAPTVNPSANRGPSDFDIRHAFSAALTYDIPVPKTNSLTNGILHGWSVQSIIQARSAPPANVFNSFISQLSNGLTSVRPDVVPGMPLYLSEPQFPGGKALNPAAFTNPPIDPNTFLPLRQGNLGRNALRSFGATQWDFGVHRDFPIRESLKLRFRAEMFNVLNHPNFGPPVADLSSATQFGQSIQTLGQSLGGGALGGGAFNPLYQLGGPRSIQFALKLSF